MDTKTLLDQLTKKRDELDALISGLRKHIGGAASHTKPAGVKPHGKVWTQAERDAMSRKLKAVFAAKRKAAAKKKPAAKKARAMPKAAA